ncbi:MAG: hypothetical protein WC479_05835 [Candidatus Izemoplasmatales bacterium]
MPNPTKDETREEYISRFMSSEEAKKSYPKEAQRLAVAHSMWKKKHSKMSGMSMEIQGSICGNEVTSDIVSDYGLKLEDIDQNGYHLIEFDLMLLDEPCHPMVEGDLDGKVMTFVFESAKATEMLASLKNKPIHINKNLDGHYDLTDTNAKQPMVVGSLLGGRITTNDEGHKVVRCLGGLFDKSFPHEVETIKAEKNTLGASFELNPKEMEIDDDSFSAKVKSWVYSGAAILKKHLAAFPQTSLLFAQGAKVSPAEGSKIMDKIYTQEDLDTAKATVKKEIEDSLTASQATALKAKEEEITTLKAQLTAKDQAIADKDQALVSVTNKVNEISAKMQETEISAQLNAWWEANKTFYDEKSKDVLLSARRALLKKEATTEQIDSLITARKSESKPKDLLGSGVLLEGKDFDMKHGIRTKEGWKRN